MFSYMLPLRFLIVNTFSEIFLGMLNHELQTSIWSLLIFAARASIVGRIILYSTKMRSRYQVTDIGSFAQLYTS